MKALFLAATAAATAYAACPNQCSGHGTCSLSDICTCYNSWDGPDCSQRKCAEDRAWAVNKADPHAYAECSGQGVCNRQTGECECFDGFTGRACARSVCPNDCSGHGVCKLLSEVKTAVAYDGSKWDAERIQTCECDAGYFGSDCSLRKCPTGDDPLTLCTSNQKSHIQEVKFAIGTLTLGDFSGGSVGTYADDTAEMALFKPLDSTQSYGTAGDFASIPTTAQMRITYKDSVGGAYVAHPVSVPFSTASNENAADSLEVALETLPDRKVNDVSVQSAVKYVLNADGSTKENNIPLRVWTVTFNADTTNSNNVGMQNALQCDTAYSCTEDGCQPKVNMPFAYRYASTNEVVAQTAITSGASSKILAYTGNLDTSADFALKKFIRLNKDSQPQMPLGIPVDDESTKIDRTDSASANGHKRYDMRILVAVVDGNQKNGVDDAVDSYYTRVILGHTNITSTTEIVANANGGVASGPWVPVNTAAATNIFTLDGFTYGGPIPSGLSKVPVPGAPGVYIDFPAQNMVADTNGRWFEILVKLPNCVVTPVTSTGAKVRDITTFATELPAVDVNVENIECSGRGMCNRKTGQCECFSGYYGLACHSQTSLV